MVSYILLRYFLVRLKPQRLRKEELRSDLKHVTNLSTFSRDGQQAKKVPDVLAFINQLAFQTGAAAMRLGVRRKQSIIRYFPADGAKTPLAELPPLPDAGCYLIQFFDKVGEPLLLEQTVIEIPSSMIKRYCRFGEGSRTRKLYP